MIDNFCSKLLGGLAAFSLAASPVVAAAQDLVVAPGAEPAEPAQQEITVGPMNIPVSVVGPKLNDPNNRAPVVVVNGAVITGTDLVHRVALLVATSGREYTEDELQFERLRVLSNLIDETLQMQASTAQEMPIEDAMVEGRYAEVAQRNFGNGPGAIDEMNRQVLAFGSSPASLKRQIRGEIAWQQLLRRNVVPFINVSREEAQERWEELQATRGETEYRIGEIYLSATPETREAVYQNAIAIVERLRQGGSFQAYARQFSEASTATVGGVLDFVQLNRLPAVMAAEVQKLQVGQLVGPIEVPGGFSIILLIDKRQVLMADPRDSILSLKQVSLAFPTSVSEAEFTTRVNAFGEALSKVGTCDNVESVAAQFGGEVVPNSAIRARDLPPQLQNILLQMQPGEATPAFGSQEEGVRSLVLCGKQLPPAAAGKTVEQIRDEIEQERIEKRANAFLRDLRNDADIQFP